MLAFTNSHYIPALTPPWPPVSEVGLLWGGKCSLVSPKISETKKAAGQVPSWVSHVNYRSIALNILKTPEGKCGSISRSRIDNSGSISYILLDISQHPKPCLPQRLSFSSLFFPTLPLFYLDSSLGQEGGLMSLLSSHVYN